MARISEEDIAKVREATDIVSIVSASVVLKQKGHVLWGNCPFHNEKTPSFKVDPTTGLWHCFGCSEGGDVFGYVMRTENMDFPEAVIHLAEAAHIDIEMSNENSATKCVREKALAVCEATAAYYHNVLRRSTSAKAADAREYLSRRGFGSEVSNFWRIGFAPGSGNLVDALRKEGHSDQSMIDANVAVRRSNGQVADRFFDRIMFPIADIRGKIIAFGGRIVAQGHPKYLNSNENIVFHKSSTMYGLERAKNSIVTSREVLVVEGYTDVIALHSAGFSNVVATLGTALTSQHTKLLSRFATRIIYIFDGDEAGQKAADRAVEFIDSTITPEASKQPVMLDVVVLPSGKDPADLATSAEGRVEFQSLVDNAVPLLRFAIDRRLARFDLRRPEERQNALVSCSAILAPVKTSVIATDYAQYIADRLSAAGARIEHSMVMQEIMRSRVVTTVQMKSEAKTTSPPEPTSNTWNGPYEPVEVEVLTLMVADYRLRAQIIPEIHAEMFTSADLGAVYSVLKQCKAQETALEILGTLDAKYQGVSTLFSHVDFKKLCEHGETMAREVIARIRIATIQREIDEKKRELKSGADSGTQATLAQDVITKQNEILRLRADYM